MSRAHTTGGSWERILSQALLSKDPVGALDVASRDETLPPSLRRALRAATTRPDGVRIAALLVAKLRFERLVRGSTEAEAWFDRAPEEFSLVFRRYHHEVLPTAFFPAGEGALFDQWCRASSRHGAQM